MLSLSLPSGNSKDPSKDSRDRVVLMVSLPPQRNKKILVEFRAGRCQVVNHEVRPLKRKGHLAVLQIHDNLLQFIWRDRTTNQIVWEASMQAGEATFQRVPLHTTTARIYYLHIFETNKKHFFWMQHNDVNQDVNNCSIIRDFLSSSPAPSPSSSSFFHHNFSSSNGSFSHSTQLDPSDLQHLLALYRSSSLPLPLIPPSSSSSSSSSFSGTSSSSSASSSPPFPDVHHGSSALSSSSSRKWITNPAWTPPASISSSLSALSPSLGSSHHHRHLTSSLASSSSSISPSTSPTTSPTLSTAEALGFPRRATTATATGLAAVSPVRVPTRMRTAIDEQQVIESRMRMRAVCASAAVGDGEPALDLKTIASNLSQTITTSPAAAGGASGPIPELLNASPASPITPASDQGPSVDPPPPSPPHDMQ